MCMETRKIGRITINGLIGQAPREESKFDDASRTAKNCLFFCILKYVFDILANPASCRIISKHEQHD